MSHGLTPQRDRRRDPDAGVARVDAGTRGPYYGAIAHNVRAVYAHYMGPYDGNPTNLDPLTPRAAALKYVEYMGGADAALGARAGGFRRRRVPLGGAGDAPPGLRRPGEPARRASWAPTRWSSSATRPNPRPGATPICRAPRNCASVRRSFRRGWPAAASCTPKVFAMMPMSMVFDFLAIRVNGGEGRGPVDPASTGSMADEGRSWRLTLSNCALSHSQGSHGAAARPR